MEVPQGGHLYGTKSHLENLFLFPVFHFVITMKKSILKGTYGFWGAKNRTFGNLMGVCTKILIFRTCFLLSSLLSSHVVD